MAYRRQTEHGEDFPMQRAQPTPDSWTPTTTTPDTENDSRSLIAAVPPETERIPERSLGDSTVRSDVVVLASHSNSHDDYYDSENGARDTTFGLEYNIPVGENELIRAETVRQHPCREATSGDSDVGGDVRRIPIPEPPPPPPPRPQTDALTSLYSLCDSSQACGRRSAMATGHQEPPPSSSPPGEEDHARGAAAGGIAHSHPQIPSPPPAGATDDGRPLEYGRRSSLSSWSLLYGNAPMPITYQQQDHHSPSAHAAAHGSSSSSSCSSSPVIDHLALTPTQEPTTTPTTFNSPNALPCQALAQHSTQYHSPPPPPSSPHHHPHPHSHTTQHHYSSLPAAGQHHTCCMSISYRRSSTSSACFSSRRSDSGLAFRPLPSPNTSSSPYLLSSESNSGVFFRQQKTTPITATTTTTTNTPCSVYPTCPSSAGWVPRPSAATEWTTTTTMTAAPTTPFSFSAHHHNSTARTLENIGSGRLADSRGDHTSVFRGVGGVRGSSSISEGHFSAAQISTLLPGDTGDSHLCGDCECWSSGMANTVTRANTSNTTTTTNNNNNNTNNTNKSPRNSHSHTVRGSKTFSNPNFNQHSCNSSINAPTNTTMSSISNGNSLTHSIQYFPHVSPCGATSITGVGVGGGTVHEGSFSLWNTTTGSNSAVVTNDLDFGSSPPRLYHPLTGSVPRTPPTHVPNASTTFCSSVSMPPVPPNVALLARYSSECMDEEGSTGGMVSGVPSAFGSSSLPVRSTSAFFPTSPPSPLMSIPGQPRQPPAPTPSYYHCYHPHLYSHYHPPPPPPPPVWWFHHQQSPQQLQTPPSSLSSDHSAGHVHPTTATAKTTAAATMMRVMMSPVQKGDSSTPIPLFPSSPWNSSDGLASDPSVGIEVDGGPVVVTPTRPSLSSLPTDPFPPTPTPWSAPLMVFRHPRSAVIPISSPVPVPYPSPPLPSSLSLSTSTGSHHDAYTVPPSAMSCPTLPVSPPPPPPPPPPPSSLSLSFPAPTPASAAWQPSASSASPPHRCEVAELPEPPGITAGAKRGDEKAEKDHDVQVREVRPIPLSASTPSSLDTTPSSIEEGRRTGSSLSLADWDTVTRQAETDTPSASLVVPEVTITPPSRLVSWMRGTSLMPDTHAPARISPTEATEMIVPGTSDITGDGVEAPPPPPPAAHDTDAGGGGGAVAALSDALPRGPYFTPDNPSHSTSHPPQNRRRRRRRRNRSRRSSHAQGSIARMQLAPPPLSPSVSQKSHSNSNSSRTSTPSDGPHGDNDDDDNDHSSGLQRGLFFKSDWSPREMDRSNVTYGSLEEVGQRSGGTAESSTGPTAQLLSEAALSLTTIDMSVWERETRASLVARHTDGGENSNNKNGTNPPSSPIPARDYLSIVMPFSAFWNATYRHQRNVAKRVESPRYHHHSSSASSVSSARVRATRTAGWSPTGLLAGGLPWLTRADHLREVTSDKTVIFPCRVEPRKDGRSGAHTKEPECDGDLSHGGVAAPEEKVEASGNGRAGQRSEHQSVEPCDDDDDDWAQSQRPSIRVVTDRNIEFTTRPSSSGQQHFRWVGPAATDGVVHEVNENFSVVWEGRRRREGEPAPSPMTSLSSETTSQQQQPPPPPSSSSSLLLSRRRCCHHPGVTLELSFGPPSTAVAQEAAAAGQSNEEAFPSCYWWKQLAHPLDDGPVDKDPLLLEMVVDVRSLPENLFCTICRCLPWKAMRGICGHLFCRRCLEKLRQHSDVCPVDREKLFSVAPSSTTSSSSSLSSSSSSSSSVFPTDALATTMTIQKGEMDGESPGGEEKIRWRQRQPRRQRGKSASRGTKGPSGAFRLRPDKACREMVEQLPCGCPTAVQTYFQRYQESHQSCPDLPNLQDSTPPRSPLEMEPAPHSGAPPPSHVHIGPVLVSDDQPHEVFRHIRQRPLFERTPSSQHGTLTVPLAAAVAFGAAHSPTLEYLPTTQLVIPTWTQSPRTVRSSSSSSSSSMRNDSSSRGCSQSQGGEEELPPSPPSPLKHQQKKQRKRKKRHRMTIKSEALTSTTVFEERSVFSAERTSEDEGKNVKNDRCHHEKNDWRSNRKRRMKRNESLFSIPPTSSTSVCNWVGALKDVPDHLLHHCRFVLRRCFYARFGCGRVGTKEELRVHNDRKRDYHTTLAASACIQTERALRIANEDNKVLARRLSSTSLQTSMWTSPTPPPTTTTPPPPTAATAAATEDSPPLSPPALFSSFTPDNATTTNSTSNCRYYYYHRRCRRRPSQTQRNDKEGEEVGVGCPSHDVLLFPATCEAEGGGGTGKSNPHFTSETLTPQMWMPVTRTPTPTTTTTTTTTPPSWTPNPCMAHPMGQSFSLPPAIGQGDVLPPTTTTAWAPSPRDEGVVSALGEGERRMNLMVDDTSDMAADGREPDREKEKKEKGSLRGSRYGCGCAHGSSASAADEGGWQRQEDLPLHFAPKAPESVDGAPFDRSIAPLYRARWIFSIQNFTRERRPIVSPPLTCRTRTDEGQPFEWQLVIIPHRTRSTPMPHDTTSSSPPFPSRESRSSISSKDIESESAVASLRVMASPLPSSAPDKITIAPSPSSTTTATRTSAMGSTPPMEVEGVDIRHRPYHPSSESFSAVEDEALRQPPQRKDGNNTNEAACHPLGQKTGSHVRVVSEWPVPAPMNLLATSTPTRSEPRSSSVAEGYGEPTPLRESLEVSSLFLFEPPLDLPPPPPPHDDDDHPEVVSPVARYESNWLAPTTSRKTEREEEGAAVAAAESITGEGTRIVSSATEWWCCCAGGESELDGGNEKRGHSRRGTLVQPDEMRRRSPVLRRQPTHKTTAAATNTRTPSNATSTITKRNSTRHRFAIGLNDDGESVCTLFAVDVNVETPDTSSPRQGHRPRHRGRSESDSGNSPSPCCSDSGSVNIIHDDEKAGSTRVDLDFTGWADRASSPPEVVSGDTYAYGDECIHRAEDPKRPDVKRSCKDEEDKVYREKKEEEEEEQEEEEELSHDLFISPLSPPPLMELHSIVTLLHPHHESLDVSLSVSASSYHSTGSGDPPSGWGLSGLLRPSWLREHGFLRSRATPTTTTTTTIHNTHNKRGPEEEEIPLYISIELVGTTR